MSRQRLYLFCPLSRCDALEADADQTMGVLWLRLERGRYEGFGVASLQASDEESLQLSMVVSRHPGVLLTRGPDDDGPKQGDRTIGVGDPLPGLGLRARATWERALADRGIRPRELSVRSEETVVVLRR